MLVESMREAARRHQGTPLFLDAGGRPWPYEDVDRMSDEVAVGLSRAGVRAGDVVALTLPSVPEYVVAYLGIAKLGAITVGVNPRLAEKERRAAIEVVGPRAVLSDAEEVRAVRVHGEAPPALPADPDRVVALVLTSGTTGTPKAAVFDERRYSAVCAIDVGLDVWGGGGPMLAPTEFAHVGFTTKLASYLRLGTTQVLMERWSAEETFRLVEEHRLTAMGGISAQFALLLRSPAIDGADLGSVERVTLGGGPASPRLRTDIMERFGAGLSVRYSSTESGGVGTGTDYDAPEDEALHTEGRPRGPVELEIRDEEGRPVAGGEVGEVCLRTPSAMCGYWHDAESTAQAFWPDGFLRSGDLGLVDDAGCLRLTGRTREMYVRGGYNVYPMEVEAVLSRHPGVRDVAVVAREDDVMGEIGVAVVVPVEPAAPPSLADLRTFSEPLLARHKLPEAVLVLDELPLTGMHKVDRAALAARVGGTGEAT